MIDKISLNSTDIKMPYAEFTIRHDSKKGGIVVDSEPVRVLLQEYPEISYSTDWCSYDDSDAMSILSPILNVFGTGSGGPNVIMGAILKMILGDSLRPALITGGLTQIKAKASDNSNMTINLNMICLSKAKSAPSGLKDYTDLSYWMDFAKAYMMCDKNATFATVFEPITDLISGKSSRSKKLQNEDGEVTISSLGNAKPGGTMEQVAERLLSVPKIMPTPHIQTLKLYKNPDQLLMQSDSIPFYIQKFEMTPSDKSQVVDGKVEPIYAEMKMELISAYRLGQNEFSNISYY